MSDVMPIEQAEFIDTLQSWFNESTNMCHEDCYNLAFIIWQHKDYLSKMLGYKQGRAEVYDEIISALEKEISYLYKGDINCGISVAIDKVKLMKEQNE